MALSAEAWLNRLYPRLIARRGELKTYDAYYRGNHPLPFLSPAHADKMRSAFRQMLDESKSNFMRLIVDVVEERLQVDGFRLSATSDLQADKASWDIWQANQMDSLSHAAFTDALVKGVSYLSVWNDQDGDEYADIAVEDALEVAVAYTPGSNFRRRDAAIKSWCDEDEGLERANIYLPDGIYKFQRRLVTEEAGGTAQAKSISGEPPNNPWLPVNGQEFVRNPLRIVPIVPLRNRVLTLCEGESELADATPVQNQINSFLFLMALAGYFGAHRQRWAIGLTLAEDEETGQVKEPFDVAIDKLWHEENPEAKFGEFGQTDLGGYLKAVEQKVAHLAITTRTPKHYLLPAGQEPSGDAIKSAESGLVRKVERKQAVFGEALEEVLRLARRFQGESDVPVDSEVVWADPATESEAVRADATIKKFAAGLIPAEQALEDLGYSQVQIARMMAQRASDALLGGLVAPAQGDATTPAPTAGTVVGTGADAEVEPAPAQIKPPMIRA